MSDACHGEDKVKETCLINIKRITDSSSNLAAVTLTGSKVAEIPCWVSSDAHVTASRLPHCYFKANERIWDL